MLKESVWLVLKKPTMVRTTLPLMEVVPGISTVFLFKVTMLPAGCS